MPTLRIIGSLDPHLQETLERAGYDLVILEDPDAVHAREIEGLTPLVLSDVGVHTASGIEAGLRRDLQATQRFIVLDEPCAAPDWTISSQQLRVLCDFGSVAVLGSGRELLIQSALRYLQCALGAEVAAIHLADPEMGLILAGSRGLAVEEAQALTAKVNGLMLNDSRKLREGIEFPSRGTAQPGPTELNAIVPIALTDSLLGTVSIRLDPQTSFTLDTLRVFGLLLALSLKNSELQVESDRAIASLRQAQQTVNQSEKLAAVGMLAAGIAHEINNPASFVIANLTVLGEYLTDLLAYSDALEAQILQCKESLRLNLAALREQHEIDYLRQDTPDLIAKSLNGMQRIHDIVRDLRSFAHKGTGEAQWVDINALISQVLKIAGAELRQRALLELDLRPLPLVRLESTRLLQVLLNLIINAYQSFADRARAQNMIWVGSERIDGRICIYVADNGLGIPDEIKDRLFEPFFTTKPVGTGTGLGLAISYEIIKNMGGRILVESVVGRGSRFTIELPLEQQDGGPGLPWREAEGS